MKKCKHCGEWLHSTNVSPPIPQYPVIPATNVSPPRQTSNSKANGYGLALFLVFILPIAWYTNLFGVLYTDLMKWYPAGTKPSAGLALPSIGPQIVTFDKYQRIQTGMSYQEVRSIIGAEGEEISSNSIEGIPGVMPGVKTVMYQWVNSNGSNMNAIFQNDKLMQKGQFGLR